MSATAASTNAPAESSASFMPRRPVWQVSYLSGLAASVAVEMWGLAARAVGVPLSAAGLGSHHATSVTVGMFAMGTMVVTFWFTFAVVLMARFAKNPSRTYLRTALAFIGVNDVELITIEGVGFGPEAADRAVSNALARVSAIAA